MGKSIAVRDFVRMALRFDRSAVRTASTCDTALPCVNRTFDWDIQTDQSIA